MTLSFNRSVVTTVLLVAATFASATSHAYYGKNSTEAELTFSATADLLLTGNPTVETLNADGRIRTKALAALDAQIQHLMGTFQSESFKAEFPYPGVLGESYDIKFTKVEAGSDTGRKLLSYKYKGKVVFQKSAFRSNAIRTVPIKLPAAPDLIYALGVVRGTNKCTDEHYNTEGDFWYFWDPDMAGCPLKGDDTNVLRLQGQLKALPNTVTTYPEYNKLYGDNANKDTLEIDVFFGYIEDIANFRHPNSRDDGRKAFKYFENDLKSRGFETTEQVDAFREYSDGRRVSGINYLHALEKTVTRAGHPLKIRVQILLADTMIESRDDTFHRYLIPAMRTADILVYDGHSGLGGNLDLASLPPVHFNQDKYQIFFFNGCSSYPYYNGMFMQAKGGSRNMDIVTSGLPTLTDSAGPNAVAFVDHFVDGEYKSYQKILSDLEASNGDDGTYLTGVNGDQDNRWQP